MKRADLKAHATITVLEALVALALAFAIVTTVTVIAAHTEEQQTRVYDANGRSIGTIAPQGEGSVRYYDSRGHSLGTSTTSGNTTTFYGSTGAVTGRTVGPAPARGGRR